jgi:predicted MFS family arabinose efflux permease
VFASTGSFWLAWGALAVMGGADAISVVIRITLLQLETPDDMRGRVSAVNSLFITMSNQIGDFRAGLVANFIGAVPAVLVGGIGTLLVVLLCIRAFPELYRVERFQQKRNE